MGEPQPVVPAVLLAAGGSRRLGRPKQLLVWRGTTLLRHAAATALASGADPVVCLLGAEADRLAGELEGLPVRRAASPEWEEGLGATFRAAVAALAEVAPAAPAALFLFVDQPLVGSAHLCRLLAHAGGTPVPAVATAWESRIGPPVLLPARWFGELAALRGDRGARELLARHRAEVVTVACPEAAYDVDSEADLAALSARANS